MRKIAVREDGTEVKRGDEITSFKGEAYEFDSITRGGSRVYAKSKTREWDQEFFPSVFGLTVVDVED